MQLGEEAEECLIHLHDILVQCCDHARLLVVDEVRPVLQRRGEGRHGLMEVVQTDLVLHRDLHLVRGQHVVHLVDHQRLGENRPFIPGHLIVVVQKDSEVVKGLGAVRERTNALLERFNGLGALRAGRHEK